MHENKLISPLLEGFLMGDAISEHDGVRCHPAMREDSDEKYIAKVISIPSSQSQLDALLLTGAYPDAASAMEYFHQQAEDVVREAEILKQLSKLQGFMPYENWQITPMDNNQMGYEVCLLSPYRRSLEKYLKSHTMSHLAAVNLGLDLCAALSICRRAGFLFVDLKPSNIFLSGDREYRIGDLGFASLDSLKYNSLPSKYCSVYTARELHDPLATLNPTADIYAVGMILYQIYNNGKLPFEDKAPATALEAPLNADYEMAEIIQKAIDPNPRKRWQTPIEMGQALVSYMQRNQVTDAPIVPPSLDPQEAQPQEAVEEESHHDEQTFTDVVSDETVPSEETGEALDEAPMTEEVHDMLAQADELLNAELPDEVVVPEIPELKIPEPEIPETVVEEIPEPETIEEPVEEDSVEETPAVETPVEKAPAEEQPQETPVATKVKDEPIPAPAKRQRRRDPEEDAFIEINRPRIGKTVIIVLLLVALLAGAGFGGMKFYKDYYLLTIDSMTVEGSEDSLSVFLRTDVDPTLLQVICTDTYGNSQTAPVVEGLAEFIGLNPGTMYRIQVKADGFHGLKGADIHSYTTPEQTKILDFAAKTGTEDGSVILSFSVSGKQTQDWMIEYSAEDEEPTSISFVGHMVTINGLTVGKTYTFKLLAPAEELWMVGTTSLEFTASRIVVAKDLAITGCIDGVLTTQWTGPVDTNVDSWTVRCYSDSGYDQTITTTETNCEFRDITLDQAYTVEVTAAGMLQSARAYVSANPATVTKLNVEAPADQRTINVTWEYEGSEPEGGWLLIYAINGGDHQAVITCTEPKAVIPNRVPGVNYELTIQAADGSTVFKGHSHYATLDSDPFKNLNIDAKDIQASLCPTPENQNWTYKDIKDEDYTSKYHPGDKASMVIYTPDVPGSSSDSIHVMFVIRNDQGHVLVDLISEVTETWQNLWNNRTRYCSLDIPAIPAAPGAYTIEVYFDGALLVEKNLTILEIQ